MRAKEFTPKDIHKLADRKGVKWDNEPSFLQLTKRLTGKAHLDDLDQVGLQKVKQHLEKQGVAEGVNNYLWHGSKTKHSVLYPQQADDTGGKEESNKNAVYATPIAKVAIAMGLTIPGSDTGMFPNDPQMVLFKGGIRKGQMVYLHKVPKDLFIKHNDREWYSKPGVKEVKPIEVVAVPVDKWLHLIRQATPQDLELQKKNLKKQGVAENNPAAGINKMFNNLGDPVYANLQRVALLAMQGRQQEASGRLQTVIKDADPAVQKKITDAVNNIKPVTINGRAADSSTLDKSKQHNDWIINTFIPWVQSLLGQQGVAESTEQKPVVIYTDHKGATIDDGIKNSLRVTQIPVDKLRLWEKHKSMQDPKIADWVTNKLLPELKQNGKLKPLLVWNNNGEFFVIDGNHRLIAYQEAGYKGNVPVQIVPDNMITVSDTVQGVAENFADGKNPGRKGLAKRSGVNTKASVSSLRKTAKNSSGEKQRMAHWLANMKAGKAKNK